MGQSQASTQEPEIIQKLGVSLTEMRKCKCMDSSCLAVDSRGMNQLSDVQLCCKHLLLLSSLSSLGLSEEKPLWSLLSWQTIPQFFNFLVSLICASFVRNAQAEIADLMFYQFVSCFSKVLTMLCKSSFISDL